MPLPGFSHEQNAYTARRVRRHFTERLTSAPYALVVLMLALLTLILWNVGWSFDRVNMAMLYLLPVLFSAVRFGRGPAYLAAGLGVLLFDFFFVPPLLSFSVSDFRYLISFAVFLVVAGLTATQASRLRQQLQKAQEREVRTASLYAISQQMVAVRDLDRVMEVIVEQLSATMQMAAAVMMPDSEGRLQSLHQAGGRFHPDMNETLADIVLRDGQVAGRGTERFGDSDILYLPVKMEVQPLGVLCVRIGQVDDGHMAEHMAFLEAVTGLAAVSITRFRLEEEAKIAQLSAESERLRTALLDSISHELRTPLATIIGSVTGLMENQEVLVSKDRAELLANIRDGALRMDRLIANLLGMVRIESGMLQLKRRWCDLSDMIGVSLRPFTDALRDRRLDVQLPEDLPPVYVDDILIDQLLTNVISNALKYSPANTDIMITVQALAEVTTLIVKDQGPGVAPEERERVFDKFYRSERFRHIPGTGLGLAICKNIALAHGGDIEVRTSQLGGAEVVLTLPRSGDLFVSIEEVIERD